MNGSACHQPVCLDKRALLVGKNDLRLSDMRVHVAQPANRILFRECPESHVRNTVIGGTETPIVGVQICTRHADDQFSGKSAQILGFDARAGAENEAATSRMPAA